MGADLNFKRNREHLLGVILGLCLLMLLGAGILALAGVLLGWKAVWWIVLGILGVLLTAFLTGLLLPFHPDKVLLEQGNLAIGGLDRRLLRLALSGSAGQAELDDFLKDWDIEAAPIRSVMLVAYIMKTRPELAFPASVTPRLQGVLSFCRFQNLKREAHFKRIGAAFNEAGIPFAILKGGAMKVYRPDFPRWMNDIDVIVPVGDFDRALQIARDLGYGDPMPTDHSVDLRIPGSDEGLLDIHRQLDLFTGKEENYNEGLFARASEVPMFSIRGLLPSREDMVFIALVNLYKNLAKNQTPESSLTTFYDIRYLLDLQPGFDWDIVRDSARQTGTEFQVCYASSVISSVLPGLFPEDLLRAGSLSKKEFSDQVAAFLFRRDVVSRARDTMAGTEAGKSLQQGWGILPFMWAAAAAVLKGLFRSRAVRRSLLGWQNLSNL